jgi:hypothetical protein
MQHKSDDYERNGHSLALMRQDLVALDCINAHGNLKMKVQLTSEMSCMLSMPQIMDNVQ